MWGQKEPQTDPVNTPHKTQPETPPWPKVAVDPPRPVGASVRTPACLGSSLHVKGQISGNEDLHIEGKVEGPISLGGHRLTVARTGVVSSEIVARETVIYGKVNGDIRARDRIEIKKDGSVEGDLTAARVVIEDGAFFKGHIEIDRGSTTVGTDLESLLARAAPRSE